MSSPETKELTEKERVLEVVKKHFPVSVDTGDCEYMNDKTIFKQKFQNCFCIVNFNSKKSELLCQIDFFNSDCHHNDLFDDWSRYGIGFNCLTFYQLQNLFDEADF